MSPGESSQRRAEIVIDSQPSASRPRNSRVPVAPRRQPAARRSAASRPDASDSVRWKVQLELAPAEIAFVYRQGLARGAEVCRRGTREWRPLVSTPELRDALALRASSPDSVELKLPTGTALTLSQTLAITDPALAALFLARRAPQLPRTAPPPPPVVSRSAPPPPLLTTTIEPVPARPAALVRTASVPDWEDTPVLPLRISPWPVAVADVAPITPALQAVATPSTVPALLHARPLELSVVAALAVVFTLAVTALTLRAEAPNSTALASAQSRPVHHGATLQPARTSEILDSAPSTIPVVSMRDLPLEGGRGGTTYSSLTRPASSPGWAHFSRGSGAERASLARALGSAAAAARGCGDGPVSAQVIVTFGPSGVARSVHFGVAPRVALRSCVLNAVARTHIAPFTGDPITVSKTLRW
jgi:hypothetical protein